MNISLTNVILESAKMNRLGQFIFIIGVATCYGRTLPNIDPDTRIVNGTEAAPGQFPFVVTVHYDGYQTCGGSILNERWIITAAHCVEGLNAQEFSIVAGTVDYNVGGVHVDAEDTIMHEGFNQPYLANDVALIKLKEPLVFNDLIQPVKLPNQGAITPGDADATVIGSGRPYSGGPRTSKIHYVKVKTFSDEVCKELIGEEGSPWETNICAGKAEGGIGECTGDSGGPLIIGDDGYQVGIVSWSIKPCASRNHPGVYTEIAYFIDWIRGNSGSK